MAVLLVNGQEMPSPASMRVTVFDVSSTADRNASGNVVIDRAGTKRKLELTWASLCGSELSRLLNAVGSEVFFTAEYPDPVTGGMNSIVCYAGDRSTGILRMIGGQPVWTKIEMNWIER